LRFEQHPLDNARIHVARFEVFDGGHRIAVLLHLDALFDDVALPYIEARIVRNGNGQIAAHLDSVLIHRISSPVKFAF